MEKIIVFSSPDKQNEAAKETAMQYARLSKEEADRSGGQAGRAGEEAERAKGYADRIDLGALDAAVLSTGTDAETALLAKQAAEQAAIDAANDANAQITPNVTAAVNAKLLAEAAASTAAADANAQITPNVVAAQLAKTQAEAARDASASVNLVNRGWVANAAALSGITSLALNDRAMTLDNEHIWRWDGSAWVDEGESPLAGKADKAKLDVEIAERADLIRNDASTEQYAVVIHDKGGREVLGLRLTDGGPTDHTRDKWMARFEDVGSFPRYRVFPGYMLAITAFDESGAERVTDLALRSSDGQFAEHVISRMAPRLMPYLGIADRPTLDGTWLHPSGDRVPYRVDRRTIVGLGSSSSNRSASAYAAIASEFGSQYVNMGDEGSTVLQNAAQIGALPALLTVSGGAIPASGAVNVTASNMPSNSNLNAFSGTLKGVHGLLAWNADVSSLQFTRTQDGEAVSVAEGEPLIPDAIGYRDKVIILESGKNDINGGVTADALLNNTIVVASWFAPYLPQTIVMGHFANGNYNSSRRNVLAAVNAGVVATFGNRAIDQQAWFTSDKLWDDLAAEGIVPTSADLADQAAGDVPQSLMTSARDHLTTAAYGYRAKYLVRPKLIEIMQYSEAQ